MLELSSDVIRLWYFIGGPNFGFFSIKALGQLIAEPN